MTIATPDTLRAAWDDARRARPMARAYDVAAALGVSELELVAARTGDARETVRLRPEWDALLTELGGLGEVMALTRNADAVIETNGRWAPFERTGGVAIVHGDDGLDLRLFLGAWRHVHALYATTPVGLRRSLQVFDGAGTAIHKVFVKEGAPEEAHAAFEALVARHRDPDQSPGVVVQPEAPLAERPDEAIDLGGFHAAWRALEDTHQFFGMLRKFGVQRGQAMRLAPPDHARVVDPSAGRAVLEHAAQSGLPLMVFVGNRGCLEIHSGAIRRVKVMGPWLNVLDKDFNLHLREDRIARAWVVSKPTSDGAVTSLELYDDAGRNIALLFGVRKPTQSEDPAWRELMSSLR